MAKAVGTTPKQLLPFAKVRASLPDSTVRSYTTQLSNTHSTDGRVLYEFHPWTGRDVFFDRMVERGGVPAAHCRLVGCEPCLPLEVPLWMFDRRACSMVRRLERPQVDLTALQALRSLLDRAVRGDGREPGPPSKVLEGQADLLSCARNPRADHAPIPAEARPVAPVPSSERQRPAQHASMAELAEPDASASDRLADAPVSGTSPAPVRRDAAGRGRR